MRWRNRSSWWGFHPYLLQPISCRNGPPRRLCFLLPAIQMTHVQSPVSEIDQGEIQTEIFAPKAPPSPLPPGCPSVRSAEKDSSGRKPPHEQIVPTEFTKRHKRGQGWRRSGVNFGIARRSGRSTLES